MVKERPYQILNIILDTQPKTLEIEGDYLEVVYNDTTADLTKVYIKINNSQRLRAKDLIGGVRTEFKKIVLEWETTENNEILTILYSFSDKLKTHKRLITIAEDLSGNKETLETIQAQTNHLMFDTDDNLQININDTSIMLPVDIQGNNLVKYAQKLNADESVAQEISLDTEGLKTVSIFFTATTSTNVYLYGSVDNVNWFPLMSWTNTKIYTTIDTGFRYLKLKSDPAGTSGTDTITLILTAKT